MSFSKMQRASRANIAAAAIAIILIVGGLLATVFFSEPLYLFNALGLGAVVIVLLIASERVAINIRNAVAQSELNTRKLASECSAALAHLDIRGRRMERVLNDTAGSAGRSSPIIRRIDASVNGLRSDFNSTARALTGGADPVTIAALNPGELEAHATGSAPISFPNAPESDRLPTFPAITVLMIADEFTLKAFAHEWNVVTATPDDWMQVIHAERPQFVFVESAWEGNGGSWKYHLVGSSAPRQAVRDLTGYCREQGIHTLFWNKEDPPHFEDFLDTASLFDFVFTTDGDKIPEYVSRLGHDRVHLLPFAAQPAIHNPKRVRGVDRDRSIVFGGMYFRDKYAERRQQLDVLLPAAEKLGLDIYSRNSGDEERYRFPERFAASVRPGIPYQQMISAYHGYKVVINVNSVVNSSSMCARRVFEATACGAAVVTTPTAAIDRFFDDDLLTLIEDESTAYDRMRALIRSDELRERRVHRAQRRIWENDTYTHRARQVMELLNLDAAEVSMRCSIVVCTNRPHNLPLIIGNFLRQNRAEQIGSIELVVVTHGFSVKEELLESVLDEVSERQDCGREPGPIVVIEADQQASLGELLNTGFDEASGEFAFRMDDDDYYGANYVRDQLNAILYSGADLVGKAETYMYFEEEDATFLTFPGKAHRETDFVRGATFAGRRKTFTETRFQEKHTGEDSDFITRLRKSGGTIYSSDRFNYVVNRHADKTRHTWAAADAHLMGTGEMKFMGSDPQQIEV
ncbi:MAG: glycosyltransferase family protein [Brevibacterium aurantiacum]|nr:glycosyltransferase [Brevibacterium sp.]